MVDDPVINDLMKSKRISTAEYELYCLYALNELGRKSLDRMMQETYMDEPSDREFNGVGFAFFDGRRSVFRDIHRAIHKVENKLKELNSVGTESGSSQ